MEDLFETVRRRRSIRRFEERPVRPETEELLKEALLRAPSSRTIRPCRFVFVTDVEKLAELAAAKPRHAGFIAGAPLAVAVCADERASDAWIEDCCVAATILQLAATALGLGSCWAQIRMREHDERSSAEDEVRAVLGLPPWMRVECVVAVGHPAEEKPPLDHGELRWDAISER